MKSIPLQAIKNAAAVLIDTDTINTNIEYNRGICELIADLDSKEDIPHDTRSKEIAIELGIPKEIANKLW